MKKIILGIILALIVGLGIYLLVKYNQAQKDPYGTFLLPRLEWSQFVFKEISAEKTTMDFAMILDNPTPIGFKVDSFAYDVTISDYTVFRSTYANTIVFKGNDSNLILLPITMYNDTLTYILDSLDMAGVDSTDYGIKGYFYADVPIVQERRFEYDQTFRAPLYKIPTTVIKDWRIKKLSLKESQLVFDLEIQNENVFPYEFKNMEYKIDLGNEMVFEGTIHEEIIIGARSTATINMPVDVDNSELFSAIIEYLKKGDDISYNFWSRIELVGNSNTIRDSPMILKARGNLSEFKDL
ncbi:MAG: LEA type 2 family protein [Owenweeksia sp.]